MRIIITNRSPHTSRRSVQWGHIFYRKEELNIKKPQTFDQLVNILKSKNIIITDDISAKTFLNRVNYYRFSGYFLPFQVNGQGPLFSNIEFERLIAIYEFDAKLRNLIAGAVDEIEIYLRTQLSYYHAHKYGEEGYMDATNYNSKHNHASFINRVNSCIKENQKTLVVKHHIKKYAGHFPIWVIIEYFSMGMISYFYADMPNSDKAAIAQNLYGVNYQIMDSWLRCLTDLRNKCAHYSRLYYWIFPALPKMPQSEKYVPTRRIFAQLYMLKLMYPDHAKWNKEVYKPFIKLVNKYKPYILMKHLDFPYRWKSMLKY